MGLREDVREALHASADPDAWMAARAFADGTWAVQTGRFPVVVAGRALPDWHDEGMADVLNSEDVRAMGDAELEHELEVLAAQMRAVQEARAEGCIGVNIVGPGGVGTFGFEWWAERRDRAIRAELRKRREGGGRWPSGGESSPPLTLMRSPT